MIRVTVYFATGRESNSHDCDSIAEAFDMCKRYGMLAHACNLRTDRLYIWRPEAANTLEAFSAKLADAPETGKRTLDQWLKQPGADQYRPITSHSPSIGIHDVRAIEHVRTYLWDLADYYVSSVQAGVIWLMPRTTEAK